MRAGTGAMMAAARAPVSRGKRNRRQAVKAAAYLFTRAAIGAVFARTRKPPDKWAPSWPRVPRRLRGRSRCPESHHGNRRSVGLI